ncbi:hypothetical protein Leryth_027534 [Lithospermum erythrorhizon]|nr:hypothetical protein Leryth_027534 [Lithospermum erythrorhizon]
MKKHTCRRNDGCTSRNSLSSDHRRPISVGQISGSLHHVLISIIPSNLLVRNLVDPSTLTLSIIHILIFIRLYHQIPQTKLVHQYSHTKPIWAANFWGEWKRTNFLFRHIGYSYVSPTSAFRLNLESIMHPNRFHLPMKSRLNATMYDCGLGPR